MAALSNYLDAEIAKRGWSIDQFAARANLSVSNAYLIIRDGKDNVRQSTFDNIAHALGMTPAELSIAIGKGAAEHDPKRVVLHARLRQVPDEDLNAVDRIIQTFTRVMPHPKAPTKPRRDRINTHSNRDDSAPDSRLTTTYHRPEQALTFNFARP